MRRLRSALTWGLLLALGTGSLSQLAGCLTSLDESHAGAAHTQGPTKQKTQGMPKGMPDQMLLHTWLPNERNGVTRPPTVQAAKAGLKDDAEILGVEVNGIARAYLLTALCDINRHIINDTVNGVPVSVVYCDISDCARGYTGPASSVSLPIHQAGMKFGDLILKVGNVLYQHSTSQALGGTLSPGEPDPSLPPFPFAPIDVRRTTWRGWKQQHPQTDVYLGVFGKSPGPTVPPQASADSAGKSAPQTAAPGPQ